MHNWRKRYLQWTNKRRWENYISDVANRRRRQHGHTKKHEDQYRRMEVRPTQGYGLGGVGCGLGGDATWRRATDARLRARRGCCGKSRRPTQVPDLGNNVARCREKGGRLALAVRNLRLHRWGPYLEEKTRAQTRARAKIIAGDIYLASH